MSEKVGAMTSQETQGLLTEIGRAFDAAFRLDVPRSEFLARVLALLEERGIPPQTEKQEEGAARVDHSQYDQPLATASEAVAGSDQRQPEDEMTRDAALEVLRDEREYQDRKWGDADAVNNVGDFILYMEREIEKARAAYIAPNFPVEAAMAGIRKVATIGVAAMEKFGAGTPRQVGP